MASGNAKTGLVYSLMRMEVNVREIKQADEFLLGSEAGDFIDAEYHGIEKSLPMNTKFYIAMCLSKFIAQTPPKSHRMSERPHY